MTTYHSIALIVLLLGCHSEVVRPSAAVHRNGLVREHSGAPSKEAQITLTDLTTAQEVTVLHADRSGRFQLQVPRGRYALAVTSVHGFAFVEKEITSAADLEIMLSPKCHRIVGHVTGAISFPAIISMSRDNEQ